jgi:hypothetical protein
MNSVIGHGSEGAGQIKGVEGLLMKPPRYSTVGPVSLGLADGVFVEGLAADKVQVTPRHEQGGNGKLPFSINFPLIFHLRVQPSAQRVLI